MQVKLRWAWRERAAKRRRADRWLLWGAEARPESELLTWRANELVSKRSRKTLARSLRSIRREAEGRAMPGPVPLNRPGIRSELGQLQALEERLSDFERPVAARGVLLVERLLTEPGSPLYSRAQGGLLGELLAEARTELDGRMPAETGRRDSAPAQPARPTHLNLLGGR